MSKNDIELPPMPRWAVYQNAEDAVQAYARVAIEPYIETLFKIGEHLGIDYHAARTAPGKPSDVYIAAIKAAEQAVLQSPEIQAMKDALRELISIVEIHSSVTKNNFAWAELDEAKSAIAAMKQK